MVLILKQMKNNKYTKLVLSGGSSKGLALIGFFKYLEEIDILKHVDTFVGTSIGCLFSLFIILGYNSVELYNIFLDLEYDITNDIKLQNFFELYGLNNGVYIEKLIKIFIKNKGFDENITLKQLFDITHLKLVCTVCDLNTSQTIFFDYLVYPDIPCYLAVKASANLPLIFTPVIYKDHNYVDGGITCNIPITYFASELESESPEQLGILCISLKEKYTHAFTEIKSLEHYFYTLIKTSVNESEKKDLKYIADLKIPIIHMNIKISNYLNFLISKSDKKNIINQGYSITKNNINFK